MTDEAVPIPNPITSGRHAPLPASPNFFFLPFSSLSHLLVLHHFRRSRAPTYTHEATMHNRPPFFTQNSIRSREMSDPQAYRISYSAQPHQATSASKRASKMASLLKRESVSAPPPAPAQSKGAAYKPGVWLYMAFATLGILTVMVALDATALSVALPVRPP